MATDESDGKHGKGRARGQGHAHGGHGHTPPGGKDQGALGWHHFHRPRGADDRGKARLAALAARGAAPAQPPDPERQPLVTRDAQGLSSPLAQGAFADLLDLALALRR